MSKFGKKFSCWSCSAKFYDLNKPDPRCPKCGADPEADPNKGQLLPAAGPGFQDDFTDEVEEVDDEDLGAGAAAGDDEEIEEEADDSGGPTSNDDY